MVVGGINFLPPQASCILWLDRPRFENIWFGILAQPAVTGLTNLVKLLKLCASVYFSAKCGWLKNTYLIGFFAKEVSTRVRCAWVGTRSAMRTSTLAPLGLLETLMTLVDGWTTLSLLCLCKKITPESSCTFWRLSNSLVWMDGLSGSLARWAPDWPSHLTQVRLMGSENTLSQRSSRTILVKDTKNAYQEKVPGSN